MIDQRTPAPARTAGPDAADARRELRHIIRACHALARAIALPGYDAAADAGLRRARLIALAQLRCRDGDRLVRQLARGIGAPAFGPDTDWQGAGVAYLLTADPVLVTLPARGERANVAAVRALVALRDHLQANTGTVAQPSAAERADQAPGLALAVTLVDLRLAARDPRGGVRLMVRSEAAARARRAGRQRQGRA